MSEQRSVSIVGPFNERRLVVNGWEVPFLQAVETDGGRMHFTLDHRFGFDCDAATFEPLAHFLADTVAVAFGLACHPSGELTYEETQRMWALLPHPALSPRRLKELGAVASDESVEED